MSDDKSKKDKADRDRINLHEPYEVSYWTRTLGCSKEQLVAAVQKAGPMAADVRTQLGK